MGTFSFGKSPTSPGSLSHHSNLSLPQSLTAEAFPRGSLGHSRVTAAHTDGMQTGAVEAVLAEPRLAQGEMLPLIVTGGWGRKGSVGGGDRRSLLVWGGTVKCTHSPVFLSSVTAGGSPGVLIPDHLLVRAPASSSPYPFPASRPTLP